MNTSDTQNSSDTQNTSRPFGYWLKAADRLMAAEFAAAFEAEHANRHDWRLLNIVDGSVPARRPLNDHKLHLLIERGWVVAEGDGWTLTDEGRAAKDRLGTIVDDIRAKVADAVSEGEMATTLASLEKIALAFGWDEETPLPRGRRHDFGAHGHDRGHDRGHGFARRFGRPFGRGFAPGHGSGPESRHGFGPDADLSADGCRHGEHGHGRHGASGQGHHGHPGEREHGEHGHRGGDEHGHRGGEHGHRGHGPHRAARFAQHAYERGFDAGFSRGRDA